MSDCDYNYYYLSKRFRLKKKKGLPLQNWCVSLERKNMILLPLLWPSSDHYPSQNLFGGDLYNRMGCIWACHFKAGIQRGNERVEHRVTFQ